MGGFDPPELVAFVLVCDEFSSINRVGRLDVVDPLYADWIRGRFPR